MPFNFFILAVTDINQYNGVQQIVDMHSSNYSTVYMKYVMGQIWLEVKKF